MNIKITDKSLRYFLDTHLTPEELAHRVSLCGPTFDHIKKIGTEYFYEIESITNRIDTSSSQGVARDSAAILNQMDIKTEMKNDPYKEKINLYPNLPNTFNFTKIDSTLIPRFIAVSFENVSIKDSPEETQTLLSLCGQRPINNAVDITNELTILYGMPSHIFDLDKLAAQKLTIRESTKGEMVTTLDNQKNILNGGDLVIEDAAGRLVDLCGVMGGQIAEVDKHTKNILYIVPVYHPKKVRRSSLYLQKRTLASQIYEKQPDTQLCLPVLTKAIDLFKQRSGARVSSKVFDSNPTTYEPKNITLDIKWANSFIGIIIPIKTYISILKSLGFETEVKSENIIDCSVPSWRYYDINIREDLVEEVARVYGYSVLPPVLPCVNLSPEPQDRILKTESKIKNFLSVQGFNEIYNNSLVSEILITEADLDPTKHLKLTNALSKDYEYLRTSLVPSILQSIKNNQGKSEEPFYLYELSNIYQKTTEKLPKEISNLVITSTTDFRLLKGIVELLFLHLNLNIYKFESSNDVPNYYLKKNTAQIISKGKIIGFIGTIKPGILHKIGITSNPVIVELIVESLSNSLQENYVYEPLSDFPEVIERITISSKKRVGDIINSIRSCSKLIKNITYTDSYQNKHSFKITFSSLQKNLTQSEVNNIKKDIQALFN
ncbi:MAG TPA: phenylalanine--tRNA ligase subunit beta [Spirochaetia bacterium]|nr:phenylalanine--tRNA ligase subunit beta [Spirochaetia bacterium]